MTDETAHDATELQHPGDAEGERHGLDDHGEDHGHDDHAHEDEELGPPDLRIWGAFLVGIVLGLVPAFGIALAIAG
ncbi:MAG TPA: hypothetical protein VFO05_06045 [Candidatus Limnocylindrales bacterium]|nr:hypothetical protein [Candidatus Limnocylindrales bacterium]